MAEGGTGIAGVDSAVAWSVGIAAVLSLLGLLVRFVAKIAKSVGIFMEDWGGEPPRPGVPGRPGVMQRVGDTEERVEDAEKRLNGVEHRLGGVERQVGRLLLGTDGAGGEVPRPEEGEALDGGHWAAS